MSETEGIKSSSIENTEFELIRSQLIAQRSSILNKTTEFKSRQKLGLVTQRADEAEAAQTDVDADVGFHLHERDRFALLKIDRALAKFINGTFGECESCGERISAKRLAARPFADLCIDCQEDLEAPKNQPLN